MKIFFKVTSTDFSREFFSTEMGVESDCLSAVLRSVESTVEGREGATRLQLTVADASGAVLVAREFGVDAGREGGYVRRLSATLDEWAGED